MHGRPPMKGQRGVALVIALIMFVVMLVSSLYLMRASTSATLMAGTLAYERALSRSADLGLNNAYTALKQAWVNNRSNLDYDAGFTGYVSNYDTTKTYRDSQFWTGSTTTTDGAGNTVQYVVHRLCPYPGDSTTPRTYANQGSLTCVQTKAVAMVAAGGVAAGSDISSDAEQFLTLPMIHYVITARVTGAKGTTVVNQMVVMMGA